MKHTFSYLGGRNVKRFLLFTSFIFLLTGCNAAKKENTYKQISMDEAVSMMETEENYIILDVRTLEEFKSKHIPGAICVPNETIGNNDIPSLPDKNQMILVYCRSGNRSKQASQKLADMGYTNIYEFGGINEWTGETYPHEGCTIPPENEGL